MKDLYDINSIRQEFPLLGVRVNGHPLVYLDNAATTQKPNSVIEVMENYYRTLNSNIHRGVHHLSEKATAAYEDSRCKVKNFIHAKSEQEIVFVRGTTEAINLVAQCMGMSLKTGDEILLSTLEHHSNIVPWQFVAERKGAKLRVVPITKQGEIDREAFESYLSEKTRIVSITHVSNALGTVVPVEEYIRLAHKYGAIVLIDGAQAVPHLPVDVVRLDCDFYAFSGHKIYGPTGIGILYGKEKWLEKMPPYQGGGDMIRSVSFEKTTYNSIPHKFEAGTPHIAGAIGLGAAIDYLNSIGIDRIHEHESSLLSHALNSLEQVPGIRLLGPPPRQRAAVVSFTMDDVHPHDIGTIVDQSGVAIRTGHHCTQPLMEILGVPATARASFGLYNTENEVEKLVDALQEVRKVFH